MTYKIHPVTGRKIEYKTKPKFKPINIDFAWAAGFFDGEGHCSFSLKSPYRDRRKYYPSIKIEIKQTDTEVLNKFRKIIRKGKVSGPYIGLNTIIFSFEARTFEKVQFIFCQLWSYLSSIKKEQYKRAASKYLSHFNNDK